MPRLAETRMFPDATLPTDAPIRSLSGPLPCRAPLRAGATPQISHGDQSALGVQAGDQRSQPGGDTRLLKEVLEAPVMRLAPGLAMLALTGETHLQAAWPAGLGVLLPSRPRREQTQTPQARGQNQFPPSPAQADRGRVGR